MNLGAGVHREACRNECFEFAVIVHEVHHQPKKSWAEGFPAEMRQRFRRDIK